MKKLVLMRGLSGSGKSTHVTNHFPSATVCSADQFFQKDDGTYDFNIKLLGTAHNSCKKKCRKALARGEELVVVDNTNSTPKEMKPYLKMAKEFGYFVEVIHLVVNVETAIARNTKDTPEWVVRRMAARFADYPGEILIPNDLD